MCFHNLLKILFFRMGNSVSYDSLVTGDQALLGIVFKRDEGEVVVVSSKHLDNKPGDKLIGMTVNGVRIDFEGKSLEETQEILSRFNCLRTLHFLGNPNVSRSFEVHGPPTKPPAIWADAAAAAEAKTKLVEAAARRARSASPEHADSAIPEKRSLPNPEHAESASPEERARSAIQEKRARCASPEDEAL